MSLGRLRERYVIASLPFTAEVARLDSHERPVFADRPVSSYRAITEGEEWGRDRSTAWFHLTGDVSPAWSGRTVMAWIEINGEGLLFDAADNALQGITHGSVYNPWTDTSRQFMPLFQPCRGGELVDLWLEGAANAMFGIAPGPEAERTGDSRYGRMTGPPARFNTAMSSGRRTPTPPETWRGSKSAPIAGSISRHLMADWPCSMTASTATASMATTST